MIPIRVARYVCVSDAGGCGRTSILLEPTEQLITAGVEQRLGRRLPTGIERQRAAIADEIQLIQVMPGRPGSTPGRARYDPRRLRVVWADGTSTSPISLPRDAVPWQSWRFNKPATNPGPASRYPADVWTAIFRAAGATLAPPPLRWSATS